jgi:predicted ATPase
MIYSIEFKNKKKFPFKYIEKGFKKNGTFHLEKKYTFEPGINVLVGCNGSGKSTIINLLRHYTLCSKSFASDANVVNNYDFFKYHGKEIKEISFLDGVIVTGDYNKTTFNLRQISDFDGDYDIAQSLGNLKHFMASSGRSDGEKNLESLSLLLNEMFGGKNDGLFPIREIKEIWENLNDVWKKQVDNLLKYYEKNHKDGERFTILMDEPDRNLDMKNSKEVFGLLSKKREDTQIIAAIHNPIMIYKLSKMKHVNLIELTENYVNDIIDFVEN